VTTARVVPVTTEMDGDELDAQDAWHLSRRIGLRRLLLDSFSRFRYADGFSHSRALALQAAMSVVPFLLALSGLAVKIDQERPARVLSRTIERISPGGGSRDALAAAVTGGPSGDHAGTVALTVGLVFSLLSMATAMAQIERGTNRIYGIERDRRAVEKYGRALVLTAVLALPVGLGFLLLVAGGSFADAMQESYGWSDTTALVWNVARWPVGLVLLVVTVAVLLDHAPRRRQPALSWLALGAAVAVLLTMAATGLLAAYVHLSGSFGAIYGPLGGVFALLVWSLASSIAFFAGAAVGAQLEFRRAGLEQPVDRDPGPPPTTRVAG
jgi:YihY family inner membrane protein